MGWEFGDWYRRTIQVDTSGVPSTQFDVDTRARMRLFENGRAAATAFLERIS